MKGCLGDFLVRGYRHIPARTAGRFVVVQGISNATLGLALGRLNPQTTRE